MKYLILVLGLVFAFGSVQVQAQEREYKGVEKQEVGDAPEVMTTSINQENKVSPSLPESASEKAKDAQTKSEDEKGNSEANKEKNDDNKNSVGESHRSAVATFVQNLLKVADRDPGIGEQVRVVAQAQNDSAKKAVDAMKKVEGRGGFKTFFIGSDYKNIGIVRSEMVTTLNQIEQLKKLAGEAYANADKASIEAQIVALEAEQAKLESFLKSKESKFSLFGWLFR